MIFDPKKNRKQGDNFEIEMGNPLHSLLILSISHPI